MRGQKRALLGSKNLIRIYAGQYYDQETGLHYNYHRYYDPSIGRYLRADPIGLDGDINLYAYVQNNPLIYSDYFGLKKSDDCSDCPGGKWDLDVGGSISAGLFKGWSRSVVKFTCLSNKKKCNGVIDCSITGLWGGGGFDWSVDVDEEIAGSGRTISGCPNFSDIENYSYTGKLFMGGSVSTTGGNLSGGLSVAVGWAKIKCKAKYIACDYN